MNRKGGKRARCVSRSIKRDRYNKSFAHRYGMPRSEWVNFKRSNPGTVVEQRRLKALARAS